MIGRRQITEFNYRYADDDDAHVFAGIRLLRGDEEREELVRKLRENDYTVVDVTDNELAKLHVRYMVGGRPPGSMEDEIVWRFQFPERPGALLAFLTRLGARWNISMFHYRNHGADYGRVLMGIQVPKAERSEFVALLDEIGFVRSEETDNPAYALFLQKRS
jgi:threonine dehydratase